LEKVLAFISPKLWLSNTDNGVVCCISERQRPERLISRLKSVGDDIGPKMVVIRQPRGPDGTKGFKQPRQAWKKSAAT